MILLEVVFLVLSLIAGLVLNVVVGSIFTMDVTLLTWLCWSAGIRLSVLVGTGI